jgi:hypothetical protein
MASLPSKSSDQLAQIIRLRRNERDRLLREALEESGQDALKHLMPLKLKLEWVGEIDWLRPCCKLEVQAHPLWEAVMSKLAANKRGKRTWALPAGKNASSDNLMGALQACPTRVTYMARRLESLLKRGGHPYSGSTLYEVPWCLRTQTPAGGKLGHSIHKAFGYHYSSKPPEAPFAHCAVAINTNGKEVFFTVCTIKNHADGLFLYDGAPSLHQWPWNDTREASPILLAHALALSDRARSLGWEVEEPAGAGKLRKALAQGLVMSRVPGAPGQAHVLAGKDLIGDELGVLEGVDWLRLGKFESGEAEGFLERWKGQAQVCIVDGSVQDAMNISNASAVDLIDRPYQQRAVGRHLATSIGYVNASPPGSGKTPMALVAMQEAAKREGNWRGLVVCGSSVVGQWMSEAQRFAPKLQTHVLQSSSAVETLESVRSLPGGQLVLCSHDLARRWRLELSLIHWNDCILDEAQLLKNPSSQRSKALWQIRKNSTRAVGLTGTPIDRSLDDLGSILAWVWDDPSLFFGERLSRRFDLRTREELWAALGGYVFRPESSEVENQMPEIDSHVEKITLHKTETRLAHAALEELKAAHERLLDKMDQEAQLASGMEKEWIQQARADLAQARHSIHSGVILARLASSCPSAVEDSVSVGAGLLIRDGWVKPAIKWQTKQKRVIEMIQERIDNQKPVLLFTDFQSVARRLGQALDKAKIANTSILGSHSAHQRTRNQRAFQGIPCQAHSESTIAIAGCGDCVSPEVDVMVLTGAGREGLNLQRAQCVIHYELPWVPSHIIQRIGRAKRIGGADRIEVLTPLAENTIEEKVASVLIPRIACALASLDPSIAVGQSLLGFEELAQTLQGEEMDLLRELQSEQSQKTK